MVISESDNVNYLYDALKSISIDQELQPNEYIIVRNGFLKKKQLEIIEEWLSKNDLNENVTLIDLPQMKTLSDSLNIGLADSSYELIARMDPDDVSLPKRFASQIKAFKLDKSLSVCGTLGNEFSDNKDIFVKKLPIRDKDIKKYSWWRNPLIHPSVMFKKVDVIKVGGYPDTKKSQDYLLWTRMITNGFKVININEVLINVRTDTDLIERRGFNYFLSEIEVLNRMYKDGSIPFSYFLANLLFRFFLRIVPKRLRLFFYNRRPKINNERY
tara:strand:- start:1585 stop:2397 length:813 start_codon:yes stop_codon:yes gene_type:complete